MSIHFHLDPTFIGTGAAGREQLFCFMRLFKLAI